MKFVLVLFLLQGYSFSPNMVPPINISYQTMEACMTAGKTFLEGSTGAVLCTNQITGETKRITHVEEQK